MKKITTIGIDLAKNIMQVHGVDRRGKAVLKKQLKRNQVASFFANLPACRVGMEACGSAHHWARKLEELGHRVKLMAPPVRQTVREDEQERRGSTPAAANKRYRGSASAAMLTSERC